MSSKHEAWLEECTSFTLEIPVAEGRKWMSLNDRDHYMAKATKTKKWIEATQRELRKISPRKMRFAHIDGRIFKNRGARYDPHNLYPTLKAIIDAIVRYGVLEDDDYRHVRTSLEHGGVEKNRDPYIKVRVHGLKETE